MAAGRGKRYLGVLVLAVLGVGCGRLSEPEKPDFESGVLSSAQVCGDCHTDIYAFWLTSRHAAAATGEAFLTAVRSLPTNARWRPVWDATRRPAR